MENVELDEVQWRSPEWIQAFGLRTDNVLDYFALSPFYDRSSNNQVLKMQTNFNEQLQSRGSDLTKELQNMKGIEFQVVIAREPNLWVIRKQDRKSPTEVDVISVYFVSGENVYQSPSIHNVLVSRILATSQHLGEAQRIAEQLPQFTALGHEYKKGSKDPANVSGGNTKGNGTPATEAETIEGEINASADAKALDQSLNIALGVSHLNRIRTAHPQR